MGVKGLWQLIAPCGKTVSLDSLEGKILAIDVSIWLNKAAKGMRDRHGNAIYNAHLVMMFHRICKLLFYGIKPVFVFDGGVPELKKRILKERQNRRTTAESSKVRTKEAMLRNLLQTKALEAITGSKSSSVKVNLKENERDLFELQPAVDTKDKVSDEESSDDEGLTTEESWLKSLNTSKVQHMFDNPESVDIDGKEFQDLPSEIKHELLTEVKDFHRKRHKYKNATQYSLPEEAGDFSSFQLQNLMKRGKITHQIDGLRKEMKGTLSAEFLEVYSDTLNYKEKKISTGKIASQSKERYVLIKKDKSNEKNILFHASLDDDYVRFQKRDSDNIQKEHFQKLERNPAKFDAMKNEDISIPALFSDESTDDETAYEPCMKKPRITLKGEKVVDEVEFMSSCTSSESELEIDSQDQKNIIDDNTECRQNEINTRSAALYNENHDFILLEEESNRRLIPLDKHTNMSTVQEDMNLTTKSNTVSTDTANDHAVINIAQGELLETVDEIAKNNIPTNEIAGGDFSANQTVEDVCLNNQKRSDVLTQDNKVFKPPTINIELYVPDSLDVPATSSNSKSLIRDKALENIQEELHDTSAVSPPSSSVVADKPFDLISPLLDQQFDFPSTMSEPSTNEVEKEESTPENEFVEKFKTNVAAKSKEELVLMEKNLEEEQKKLTKDKQKQTRLATTITGEMYQDVQEMLQLFGIPFVISPMEAEAQCACLDYTNLTDGSITEDSDIFLFGAHVVYKNMFNQNKTVEMFESKHLENLLYLSRKKLVALAFLTGSDYTEGIAGVGGVTAMEILQEFSRLDPVDTLTYFKKWLITSHQSPQKLNTTGLRSKLKGTSVPMNFNSEEVWEAYLNAEVDHSDEKFEWGSLDEESIKEFASEKLGWLNNHTDEVLRPVLQRINSKTKRTNTLDKYFAPKLKAADKEVTSKRLKKVLDQMGNPKSSYLIKKEEEELFNDSFELSDSNTQNIPSTININKQTSSRSYNNRKYNPSDLIVTSRDAQARERKLSTEKKAGASSNVTINNVSQNPHVQAKKVENLMKAAINNMKAPSPFVRSTMMNDAIQRRLNRRGRGKGKKRVVPDRSKIAVALLNQVDTVTQQQQQDVPKPLMSSESDSD